MSDTDNTHASDQRTTAQRIEEKLGPIIEQAKRNVPVGATAGVEADIMTRDLPPEYKVAILDAAFPYGASSVHVEAIKKANGILVTAWFNAVDSYPPNVHQVFLFDEVLRSPHSPIGNSSDAVKAAANEAADRAKASLGDWRPS